MYRRFPTKEDLLYAVVRQLTETVLADFADKTDGMTLPQAVVEVFCAAVQETKNNPVLRQLTVAEPDTLGALLGFVGPGMDVLLSHVVELAVEQARHAGAQMSDRDLRVAVEMVVRLTTSLMNSPSPLIDLDDAVDTRKFAEQFLAPMIW